MVFDGARLPSKSGTEAGRRSKRKEALEQAQIHLQNHRYEQANECFRKAVDIKPSMAHQLILQLQKEGIEYVVAPYEADAQLAHLARTGYVSCVITEDSDLVPFGTPKIFFKMDKYGHGTEMTLSNLTSMPGKDGLDFSRFTHDMVLRMCILSGCDYLDSLPGVGPKTAYKIIKDNRTIPKIMECLKKMGKFKKIDLAPSLSLEDQIQCSPSLSGASLAVSASQETSLTEEEYRELFVRAELTFKHQRVFDILSQEMISLTPPPSALTEEDITFCGPIKPRDIVIEICTGMIDPMSHKPFVSSSNNMRQKASITPLNTNKIDTYFKATPAKPVFKTPFKNSQEPVSILQFLFQHNQGITSFRFFYSLHASFFDKNPNFPFSTNTKDNHKQIFCI